MNEVSVNARKAGLKATGAIAHFENTMANG